jgi:ribose transport system substrate-binding protein
MRHHKRGNATTRAIIWVCVLLIAAAGITTLIALKGREAPVRAALVTADDDIYWTRLIEGAEAAAGIYDVDLTVFRGDGSTETQTDLILRARDAGYTALAVSPVDENQQAVLLRGIGRQSSLVTVDSDCELSGRICFVGADNYEAGRRSGQMIRQAMPDGARVLIVMGPIAKANGERRRQGIIDELLDRSRGPGRPTEPLDDVHAGERYTVAATVIDPIDTETATANTRAALEADPSIDCVVGLFAYSGPAALVAVEELGRLDGVTVFAFDDNEETLAAIASGKIAGTIAQDQYSYGFASVRLLADASRGIEEYSIPVTEEIHFDPISVTAENLATYRATLRDTRGTARSNGDKSNG